VDAREGEGVQIFGAEWEVVVVCLDGGDVVEGGRDPCIGYGTCDRFEVYGYWSGMRWKAINAAPPASLPMTTVHRSALTSERY